MPTPSGVTVPSEGHYVIDLKDWNKDAYEFLANEGVAVKHLKFTNVSNATSVKHVSNDGALREMFHTFIRNLKHIEVIDLSELSAVASYTGDKRALPAFEGMDGLREVILPPDGNALFLGWLQKSKGRLCKSNGVHNAPCVTSAPSPDKATPADAAVEISKSDAPQQHEDATPTPQPSNGNSAPLQPAGPVNDSAKQRRGGEEINDGKTPTTQPSNGNSAPLQARGTVNDSAKQRRGGEEINDGKTPTPQPTNGNAETPQPTDALNISSHDKRDVGESVSSVAPPVSDDVAKVIEAERNHNNGKHAVAVAPSPPKAKVRCGC